MQLLVDFLSGFIPGSIFVRRYSKKSMVPQILGLILMEIVPYIIVCMFLDFSYMRSLVGFILLYSVYEFGYLQNDIISIKHELQGKTHRHTFDSFNFKAFLISRAALLLSLLVYILNINFVSLGFVSINLGCLAIAFYLHNTIATTETRVATFLYLNVGKIVFRLCFIDSTAIVFLAATIPHLLVKCVEYLGAKKLINFGNYSLNSFKICAYLPLLFVYVLDDWRMAVVTLPFFINHCKIQLLKFANIKAKA